MHLRCHINRLYRIFLLSSDLRFREITHFIRPYPRHNKHMLCRQIPMTNFLSITISHSKQNISYNIPYQFLFNILLFVLSAPLIYQFVQSAEFRCRPLKQNEKLLIRFIVILSIVLDHKGVRLVLHENCHIG